MVSKRELTEEELIKQAKKIAKKHKKMAAAQDIYLALLALKENSKVARGVSIDRNKEKPIVADLLYMAARMAYRQYCKDNPKATEKDKNTYKKNILKLCSSKNMVTKMSSHLQDVDHFMNKRKEKVEVLLKEIKEKSQTPAKERESSPQPKDPAQKEIEIHRIKSWTPARKTESSPQPKDPAQKKIGIHRIPPKRIHRTQKG